jgi:hypothetical protein
VFAAAIDRRLFLKSTAAFTATLPFAPSERGLAAEAELIARCLLFDDADYASVTVSPDGWHLSWLAPVNGVRNLFVARIDDPASGRAVTRVTDRGISRSIAGHTPTATSYSSRIATVTRTGAPPVSISGTVPSLRFRRRRASGPL